MFQKIHSIKSWLKYICLKQLRGKWAPAWESGHLVVNHLSTQFQHDTERPPFRCLVKSYTLTHWQYHQHYWLLVTDCTFSLCLFKEAQREDLEILLHFSELQILNKNSQKGVQAACKPESPLGSEVKKGHIVWNGPHSHLGTITETYKLQTEMAGCCIHGNRCWLGQSAL